MVHDLHHISEHLLEYIIQNSSSLFSSKNTYYFYE